MAKKDSKKRNRNIRASQKRASNKKRRTSIKAQKASKEAGYEASLDTRIQASHIQKRSILPYIRIKRSTTKPKLPVVLESMKVDSTDVPVQKIERTK